MQTPVLVLSDKCIGKQVRNSAAIVICWNRAESVVPGQNKLFIPHFWRYIFFSIVRVK